MEPLTKAEEQFIRKAYDIAERYYRTAERHSPGAVKNNVALAFHEATLPLYLEFAFSSRYNGWLSMSDVLALIGQGSPNYQEPSSTDLIAPYLFQLADLLLHDQDVDTWAGLELLARMAPPPFCSFAKDIISAPVADFIKSCTGSIAEFEKILRILDYRWAGAYYQHSVLEQRLLEVLVLGPASQKVPIEKLITFENLMKMLADDLDPNERVIPTRLNLAVAASGVDPSKTAHLLMPWLHDLLADPEHRQAQGVAAKDVNEAKVAFGKVWRLKYLPLGYETPVIDFSVFDAIQSLLEGDEPASLLSVFERMALFSNACSVLLFIALHVSGIERDYLIKSVSIFLDSEDRYSDCMDALFTEWGPDAPTYRWWVEKLLPHVGSDTTIKFLVKYLDVLQQGFQDRNAYPAAADYTYSEGLAYEDMREAVTDELNRLAREYHKGILNTLDLDIKTAMATPSEEHFTAVEKSYYAARQALEDSTIDSGALTPQEQDLLKYADNYVKFLNRIRQITGVSGGMNPDELRAQIAFLLQQLSEIEPQPTKNEDADLSKAMAIYPHLQSFYYIMKFESRMQMLLRRFLDKDPENQHRAVNGIVEGWKELGSKAPFRGADDLLKAEHLEQAVSTLHWVCMLASKSLRYEFFRPKSAEEVEVLAYLKPLVKDRNSVNHIKEWTFDDAEAIGYQLKRLLSRLRD